MCFLNEDLSNLRARAVSNRAMLPSFHSKVTSLTLTPESLQVRNKLAGENKHHKLYMLLPKEAPQIVSPSFLLEF